MNLAPKGDIEVSFEWDDSVITDTSVELDQRLRLQSAGIMSKVEVRMWYLGETRQQAEEAIAQIGTDSINSMAAAQGIPRGSSSFRGARASGRNTKVPPFARWKTM